MERTVANTIMDGLVAKDAPEFYYTPSGSGYVETAPLGIGQINYVVVGYVSADQRVVRAGCKPEEETPDPQEPGELVLCTVSKEAGAKNKGDFCYEYRSHEKGQFSVTCKVISAAALV